MNTYRIPVRMIIRGSEDIMSVEGTTQGDNLAMCFYAIEIALIIEHLRLSTPLVKNVALADDNWSMQNFRTQILVGGTDC